MTRTALVLGATGGIGGETARALLRKGWEVRGMTRALPTTAPHDGIEWRQGDAMVLDDVLDAAWGANAIVHAVNPPGYRDWDRLALPMLRNSIMAADLMNARLVLPGTIYNYDVRQLPLAAPDSPQRPRTRKGAIRVAMEREIEASGVRALIVRAGDFFGPRPGGSWFSQCMVSPGRPVRAVTYPGRRGVGHSWAYLPDLAETFARLLERDGDLPGFARFHFRGVWDGDGRTMTGAIARAVGNPDLRVGSFPWALLPLLAPFNTMLREMIEMKPLWRHPLRLDNRELVAFLGEEPHTPVDIAVARTLAALGCLDQSSGHRQIEVALA